MKKVQIFAVALFISTAALLPTACKKEGDAEKLGKQLDQKMDKGAEKIEQMREDLKDKMKEAGDKAEEATK